MSDNSRFSRRNFLKSAGMVAGAAALGNGALALVENAPGTAQAATAQHSSTGASNSAPRGRMFFTNDLEFETLSEAAERIFPQDASGPGAKALAVPYFIDNQLAGAYGYNAREYMQGPFAAGAPTQGYQTPLLRRDIFLQGLAALNAQAQADFKKNFPELGAADQDKILKLCESGKIATQGFASSHFFDLLKNLVLAGAYADPIYGGNNGMNGWKMKNYPGAQMAYADVITSKKFESIAPVSLSDMQH